MRDWKNAFGQPPESFSARVYYTVTNLDESKPQPQRKLFPRKLVAGLCALILILTSAMTFSHRLSLSEYFHYYRGQNMGSVAAELVERDFCGMADVAGVKFSLREAVCDGENFYIILECRAPENILLAAMNASPGDKAAKYDLTIPQDARSLQQYAADNHKSLAYVNANVYAEGSPVAYSADWWLEENGVLCIWLSGRGDLEEYTCYVRVVQNWDSVSARAFTGSFDFSLSGRGLADIAFYDPDGMVMGGVKLERVVMKETPLGTYVRIRGQATSDRDSAVNLWFRVWDEQGKQYRTGFSGVGSFSWQAGKVIYDMCLEPGRLPETLTLEGYDMDTGRSFGRIRLEKTERAEPESKISGGAGQFGAPSARLLGERKTPAVAGRP